jgi:hypothetical protein
MSNTNTFISKLFTVILALCSGGEQQPDPNVIMNENVGYIGTYRLSAVYNEAQESVVLPSMDYTFDIKKNETSTSSNAYSFGITLGNLFDGSFIVTSSVDNTPDSVTFNSLSSTKMLPPDDVFAVEVALAAALNDATSIQWNDTSILEIGGEKGKIVGTKEE